MKLKLTFNNKNKGKKPIGKIVFKKKTPIKVKIKTPKVPQRSKGGKYV